MTNERGLALIVALLVVALTAMIAAALMRGESVWFKESTNIRALAQARAAMNGAFKLAAVEVTLESRHDPIDSLTQRWAQPFPRVPVAGGVVRATLVDPAGRFNVNDLVVAGQSVPSAVAVFTRLLQLVGLNPALAQAVVAWEMPPGTAGAGLDAVYLGRRTPYRAGRQPLSGVSELRLVSGFNAKMVRDLRPYLTALPQVTAINVNTAPALVLASLCPGLTIKQAQVLGAQALQTPFTSPAAFQTALPHGVSPDYQTSVQTNYFLAHVTARFGGLVARRRALLYRPARGQTTVILWQEALWQHHHPKRSHS
ncbi:MAG: type II secretion system minor pseudopilin GspK [Acidiferrobacter sp.]